MLLDMLWFYMCDVKVRDYVVELFELKKDLFQAKAVGVVPFLESKWTDIQDSARVFASEHLNDSWTIEDIIRVCDSTHIEVRDFGLSTLRTFLLGDEDSLWSTANHEQLSEIARRLSQHPSEKVEKFLMDLFAEHDADKNAPPLLGHPSHLIVLEPCFKRIFSRVNKNRAIKTQLWALLKQRGTASQSHAQAIYPLLSWMSGTHLKKDKFQSIQLMFELQSTFPQMKIDPEISRLKFK